MTFSVPLRVRIRVGFFFCMCVCMCALRKEGWRDWCCTCTEGMHACMCVHAGMNALQMQEVLTTGDGWSHAKFEGFVAFLTHLPNSKIKGFVAFLTPLPNSKIKGFVSSTRRAKGKNPARLHSCLIRCDCLRTSCQYCVCVAHGNLTHIPRHFNSDVRAHIFL